MPTELVEHSLEDRNKGFVVEDEVVAVVAVAVDAAAVVVVGSKKGKRVEHLDLESKCHEAVELGMDKVELVC
jgi:hypothetical protein